MTIILRRRVVCNKVYRPNRLVHTVVGNFAKRLKNESGSALSLLERTTKLVSENQEVLQDYLEVGINTQRPPISDVWNSLLLKAKGIDKVSDERKQLLLEGKKHVRVPQIAYNKFLKALYPFKEVYTHQDELSLGSNFARFSLINHDLIYKEYSELPKPAPLYMEPNHLEEFLDQFFFLRDFIRPTNMGRSFKSSSKVIYARYREQANRRKNHISMCSHIIEDMKMAGLPLSTQERNRLIFMSFFKDDHQIIQKVTRAVEALNLGEEKSRLLSNKDFNWKSYKTIKEQFIQESSEGKLHISTYNTLLSIACRHDCAVVLNDILHDLGLDFLLEVTNESKPIASANRETIEILLSYFSYNPRGKNADKFYSVVKYLTESNITPDIRIVNEIIKGLIRLERMDEANYVLYCLFQNPGLTLNTYPDSSQFSPERIIEKGLTYECKKYYKEVLQIYDFVKHVLNEKNISVESHFEVRPNESTFKPFLDYYCSPTNANFSAEGVLAYIRDAEENGLILTTRMFQVIFEKFITMNSGHHPDTDWSYDMLNAVTSKFLHNHDIMTSSHPSERESVSKLILDDRLSTDFDSAKVYQDLKGRFIKVSDHMVNIITQAHITVINNSGFIDSNKKKSIVHHIKQSKLELFECVQDKRKSTPMRRDQSLSVNEEVVYLKKAFIIDLIDLVHLW
ncbi:Piso0_003405 [Millerozyma farinosa CBS 7064]|uniref:Piso0_003405 protein n=1 Tax=Pichia sorbitophila (strain ATCC MYA-4447 / BCRC 22081 / CBS 7064 / NBRC 10061 / NRRL Y-12695) TaxID=559304 RepID=G8YIZ7_PICSO|nr:Piso0_003405 [Millerozyma farinosa CBS 7064]CCE81057.1 Piso0_003405 [Millerozyma farinosa CBS 7064]